MPETEPFDAVMGEVASNRVTVGNMHHEALATFAAGSTRLTRAAGDTVPGPRPEVEAFDVDGNPVGAPTPTAAAASATVDAAAALAPSGKIVASVPDRLSKPVRNRLCWFLGWVAVFALLVGAVVANGNSSQAVPLFLIGGTVSIGALAFMYLTAMGFGKVDLQASVSGGSSGSGGASGGGDAQEPQPEQPKPAATPPAVPPAEQPNPAQPEPAVPKPMDDPAGGGGTPPRRDA